MASILVIDDSAEIRELVCRVMTREGHDVREALNGVEGVTLYKEARPDLVFTDLFMPQKNGIETITDLYDFDETVNVIAMTSHGREENYDFLRVARALGAVNTLQKPFRVDELKKAAENALKG